RAMNMAPFIFWNLAFYTIIRTQLRCLITSASVIVTGTARIVNENHFLFLFFKVVFFDRNTTLREKNNQLK
ncbi:hypothetical protein ABNC64_20290, partial [Paenibacillus larvae]